jgi:hypothetical protein
MPRDICVIKNELDTLLKNARVWQELVRSQRDEKLVVQSDTIYLYQELIDKAFLVLDALSKEVKDHPNTQNPKNDKEAKKEFTAIEINPVSKAEEMVGGKRQKKRKSKKHMKKRKSGKKTRRSKK